MRRYVSTLALGAWSALWLSCGVGDAPTTDSSSGRRASSLRPVSTVVLTDLHAVQAKGRFLVTPRWSPDGASLLLSGWHGIGLHSLELATGRVSDLDKEFRGRTRWDETGRVARFVPIEEDGNWVVGELGERRILYRPHNGAIEAVESGHATELAAGGAWGVQVSRDATRVAYCTGHLATSRLRVVNTRGETLFEGQGTHAAWLPNGEGILYAAQEPVVSVDGEVELGGSELHLVGEPSWTPVRLTATPDITEMEPAIAPRGDVIAFSDWESGTVWTARLTEKGGEP